MKQNIVLNKSIITLKKKIWQQKTIQESRKKKSRLNKKLLKK